MDRFWSKVDKTKDCWNWTASKSAFGHGRFNIGGKIFSPHRLVYEWKYGEIPEGMIICHTCDNPSCVKLEHLFLGTYSDNAKDAYDKGRIPHLLDIIHARGEQNAKSKLTNETVRQLRQEYKEGNTNYAILGRKYGISRGNARRAIKHITWKHID